MTDEAELRDQIVDLCRSLFERGFAHGSAGNVSARLDANVLVSPTNSCLGRLDPARLSKVTLAGKHVGGDKPSKEAPLHLGIYRERARRRRRSCTCTRPTPPCCPASPIRTRRTPWRRSRPI